MAILELGDLSPAETWRIAWEALSVRMARWLSLILTFVLFGYDVLDPAWPRLAGAVGFAAMCFLPIWLRKEK
jgi:hypothetical protein